MLCDWRLRASGMQYEVCHFTLILSSHHVETNADGWPDDVRLSDIELSFLYPLQQEGCGGAAEVSQTRMGTG